MPETMTSRERWLAAVQCQPVDRLPFWPKINGAYTPHQAAPFRDMSILELHAWIGSDPHVGAPPCVKVVRRKTSIEQQEENGIRRTLYHTPAGTLTSTDRFDPTSHSWHPREFPVKCAEDIEVLTWMYTDARGEFDPDQFEKARALIRDLGERAIVTTGLGISPLMDWIQHLAGIEHGLLMLRDLPQQVEILFEAMHRFLCCRAEIMAEQCPCDVIYSVENTSTTLISPELFRRYCLKHLMDYGRLIRAAGKLHLLHMCGQLFQLLPDINTLPAAGIEAFTSPPVGNTTLLDGRRACPEKCLIGGTSATLWLKPSETILRTIEHDLDDLPHHRGIVVTSAGVMPPLCPPETIRRVAEGVKAYAVG